MPERIVDSILKNGVAIAPLVFRQRPALTSSPITLQVTATGKPGERLRAVGLDTSVAYVEADLNDSVWVNISTGALALPVVAAGTLVTVRIRLVTLTRVAGQNLRLYASLRLSAKSGSY